MTTYLEEKQESEFTADGFRGRRVVDHEGIFYGKVKHIHINSETLVVSGVTVHEGFHKEYFLTKDYIEKITEKTVLLRTPPIRKGSDVVDIDGNKIGKVRRIQKNTETEEIDSIEITTGLFHTKILTRNEIWGVGEKVILKSTREHYKKAEN